MDVCFLGWSGYYHIWFYITFSEKIRSENEGINSYDQRSNCRLESINYKMDVHFLDWSGNSLIWLYSAIHE